MGDVLESKRKTEFEGKKYLGFQAHWQCLFALRLLARHLKTTAYQLKVNVVLSENPNANVKRYYQTGNRFGKKKKSVKRTERKGYSQGNKSP